MWFHFLVLTKCEQNTEHSCSIYRLCSILTVHTHFTARLPFLNTNYRYVVRLCIFRYFFITYACRKQAFGFGSNARIWEVKIIRPGCRPWPAILDWWETKYNMSKSRGFPYYSPLKMVVLCLFLLNVIRILTYPG